MASGRIELTSGAAWAGYITWSSTQNVADNTSSVVAELFAYKTDLNTTGANGPGFNGILKIGDSEISFSYVNEYPDANGVGVQHATLSKTVSHDSGTGAGSVFISGSISGPGGTSLYGITLSGSQTVDLGTIARASTISVDKETVQMLTPLLISIDRKNPDFKHYLYYWDGIAANWVLFASQVEQSYSWMVPDLVSIMPGLVSGNLWIICLTYSGNTKIGSDRIKLTMTVPDATVPSIESNTATMGTSKTISCPRNSVSFRNVLTFSMGELTETIADGQIDSFTWSPMYDYAKQIPNLTYGAGFLKCETYNMTAKVGEHSIPVKLVVPENEVTRPVFTASGLKIKPVTDLTGALSSIFIRGKTGAMAEFTASSEYSTIAMCELWFGSVYALGNPAVINTIVNDGDVEIRAKVTDARGFSTTIQTSTLVKPYQKPKIIPHTGYVQVICERAKSTGELSSDGTFLAIEAGKSFSSIQVDGVEQNSCVLRYRHRTAGAENYGDWNVLLSSDSVQSEISTLISDVVPSVSTSYDIELEALDNLGGSHRLYFQIMTSHVSFVLYDGLDGAGFGKYPESPHVVDIAAHMTLLVRGKLVVLGSGWEALSLASGVSESAYQFGRVEDCKYQVKDGNHVFAAFNCSFVYAGQVLTVNGTAIPEEYRPARTVLSLCPVNNDGTALVSVTPDGLIQVERVKRDGENGEHPVLWIDGYIDYWT